MSERKTITTCIKDVSLHEILDGMSPADIIDKMTTIANAYSGRFIFFRLQGYGYDGAFDLQLYEKRLETDKEYQKRLDAEAAITNKTRAAKLKKEEKERKEYERLKKKFEKVVK